MELTNMLSKIVQESVAQMRKTAHEAEVQFLISSQISLLSAELERKKGMIVEAPSGDAGRFAYEDEWYVGYNQAIQEDITYLEEQIAEIKKLI